MRDGHLKDLLNVTARMALMEALGRHNWNKSRAARDLGITLPTLRKYVKELGLVRPVVEHEAGPGIIAAVEVPEVRAESAAVGGAEGERMAAFL